MGQTSKYNLRYPESTDFVRNTATYIQNLAEDVETTLGDYTPTGGGGKGADTLPIGAIMPYSSGTIPENWLLCDGSEISSEDYPELFSLLAGKYGTGSTQTKVKLPDLRGKVVAGKDSTDEDFEDLGVTGGEKTHTLTISEMPSHNHALSFDQTDGSNANGLKTGVATVYKGTYNLIEATGGGQAHNNLQPYVTVNFIIKAKKEATVLAIEDSLPIGTIVNYDGNEIPSGYIAVEDEKINIITGQEFETGRKIDNKKEYGKRINFGNLPNAIEKSFSTNLKTSEVTLTGVDGIAYTNTGEDDYALTLPDINPNDASQATRLTFDTGIADGNRVWNVKVRTGIDRSNYVAYINVYYIKK